MKKRRLTLDDLIPSNRNEGHFQVIQDKSTGSPKVIKKGAKKGGLLYCHQYPTFFRLLRDNDLIPKPIEEFRFHPVRRWRVDICWPEQKLALEIEGGTYMKKGGHRGSINGYLSDMEKYNNLSLMGYRLLRFTPQQMTNCEAYEVLREWFKNNSEGFIDTGEIKIQAEF